MEKLQLWFLVFASIMGVIAQEDLYGKVFVFLNDPNNAHVIVKPEPEQPLKNFTMCLRSFTDLTRPYVLFSYATKAQNNEILLFKPKPREYRLYVGGEFVTFRVPEVHMAWEHVCASWESTTGITEFWVNGKPLPRKGLQKGYSISAEAMIVLGQDQNNFGGGFHLNNSFTGEMADMYMWGYGLSPYNIQAAYYSLYLPPSPLGWRNLQYDLKGDVVVKPKL